MTPCRPLSLCAALLATTLLGAAPVAADPLGKGWTLDPQASRLGFQSVRDGATVETGTFAALGGTIDPEGKATVRIELESVDTRADLRDVRLRFVLFEAWRFPVATVETTLDPAFLDRLATERRLPLDLEFTLDLHGVERTLTAPVTVTLVSDALVSVSSAEAIPLAVKDFGLEDGLARLERSAHVEILPTAAVSFDFVFARIGGAPAPEPVAEVAPAAPDEAACTDRFEAAAGSGTITFESGSAILAGDSRATLDAVAEVVRLCPDLTVTVEGHTDSAGDAALNQRLSERRAQSVSTYIVDTGIANERLRAKGYGETRPLVANDTAANRGRNRRIEFVVGGDVEGG